jgi:hypothetical protein
MRPYLAVIKDSFRQAAASRVLWILLAVITLGLLLLTPLGWRRELATGVGYEDVRDMQALVVTLQAAGKATEPSPAQHIWRLLPEPTRKALNEDVTLESGDRMADYRIKELLLAELNKLLKRDDFFRAPLWAETSLNQEARDLIARGPQRLSAIERQRRNRLALEAALPGQVRPGPKQAVRFSYLVWDIGAPWSISDTQLRQGIGLVLTTLISVVVGIVGVLVAILVTASIIPNMFDAGSVALLLSKPISRCLLFLAKFLGGCWFVLLIAGYLIGGLWLVLGLRLGFWQHRLLLCVPIFLFLFLVYYSVSALAGLIWRNTIVAVMVTVLFWLVCVAVGGAKQGVEMVFVNPNRVVQLVSADGQLLAANDRGRVSRWDTQSSQWQEILVAADHAGAGPPFAVRAPLIGPVYDTRQKRLVAVAPLWPQAKLVTGYGAEEWQRVERTGVPPGPRQWLVEPDGRLLLVARGGLFRLQDGPTAPAQSLEVFGWKLPLGGSGGLFEAVGPEPPSPTAIGAALNRDSGSVFAYDGRRLVRFAPNEEGAYRTSKAVELQRSERSVLMAAAGNSLLLAWGDGRIEILSTDSLELQREFAPEGRNQPRLALAAPGGRWFAVLFHHRRLWLFDTQQQTTPDVKVVGQGDISAVTFAGPNRLLVADRVNRVSDYQLPQANLQRSVAPPPTKMESLYRFVIQPVYALFPKPGELDNSVTYLLTERNTVQVGRGRGDLSATQITIDPWGPVWSSLAFVLVTLAVACLYLHREDF